MVVDRRLNPLSITDEACVLGKISFFILIIITCGAEQAIANFELL